MAFEYAVGMINVPNAITLVRFTLVPAISLQLLQREYSAALVLFIVSALSDVADGMIARHWNQRTRFGAVADPLADKLTMLTVTVVLPLAQKAAVVALAVPPTEAGLTGTEFVVE